METMGGGQERERERYRVTGTALDLALMYKLGGGRRVGEGEGGERERRRRHGVYTAYVYTVRPCAASRHRVPTLGKCRSAFIIPLAPPPPINDSLPLFRSLGERALNYICHFSVSCASMVINFTSGNYDFTARVDAAWNSRSWQVKISKPSPLPPPPTPPRKNLARNERNESVPFLFSFSSFLFFSFFSFLIIINPTSIRQEVRNLPVSPSLELDLSSKRFENRERKEMVGSRSWISRFA